MMVSLHLRCDEGTERGNFFAFVSRVSVEDSGQTDFELHRSVLLEAPSEQVLVADRGREEFSSISKAAQSLANGQRRSHFATVQTIDTMSFRERTACARPPALKSVCYSSKVNRSREVTLPLALHFVRTFQSKPSSSSWMQTQFLSVTG